MRTMRAAFVSGSGLRCQRRPVVAAVPATPVTFTKDVAPIFQEKCQDCHRKGTMAPMSLVTYEETRPWAKSIRERVVTRKMPPWHIDKTVGIQKFQNDLSLSDEQIATIVRWVDAGAPHGRPEGHAPAQAVARTTTAGSWRSSSASRIWSSSRMPTRCRRTARMSGSSPLTDDSAHRAALGARRRDASGHAGGPQDHAPRAGAAQQDETAVATRRSRTTRRRMRRPGPADGMGHRQELRYLPSQHRQAAAARLAASGGNCTITPSAKQIRDHAELAVYLYPKGQEPKYRTYLTLFSATANAGARHSISRRTRSSKTQGFSRADGSPRGSRISSRTCTCAARRWRMEAILPDGTTQMLSYVDNFNFNWMTNYIYADDAAPVLPEGHGHPRHRLARQHARQSEQSRSRPVGRLRRPHGGRDGARLGERHLHQRRRTTTSGLRQHRPRRSRFRAPR